jgi:hypothetical protein
LPLARAAGIRFARNEVQCERTMKKAGLARLSSSDQSTSKTLAFSM